MAKIDNTVDGVLHVGDVFLRAGDEVPRGVIVPDEFLAAPVKEPAPSKSTTKK